MTAEQYIGSRRLKARILSTYAGDYGYFGNQNFFDEYGRTCDMVSIRKYNSNDMAKFMKLSAKGNFEAIRLLMRRIKRRETNRIRRAIFNRSLY